MGQLPKEIAGEFMAAMSEITEAERLIDVAEQALETSQANAEGKAVVAEPGHYLWLPERQDITEAWDLKPFGLVQFGSEPHMVEGWTAINLLPEPKVAQLDALQELDGKAAFIGQLMVYEDGVIKLYDGITEEESMVRTQVVDPSEIVYSGLAEIRELFPSFTPEETE